MNVSQRQRHSVKEEGPSLSYVGLPFVVAVVVGFVFVMVYSRDKKKKKRSRQKNILLQVNIPLCKGR